MKPNSSFQKSQKFVFKSKVSFSIFWLKYCTLLKFIEKIYKNQNFKLSKLTRFFKNLVTKRSVHCIVIITKKLVADQKFHFTLSGQNAKIY